MDMNRKMFVWLKNRYIAFIRKSNNDPKTKKIQKNKNLLYHT